MSVLMPIFAILGFTSVQAADVTPGQYSRRCSSPKIIPVQLAEQVN
jgi:hypothetical protein